MHLQKVEDRQVIFAATILARDEELVTIEFSHENTDYKFGIQFLPGDPANKTAHWTYLNDTIQIVISGWNSSAGVALNRPQRLGVTEDGKDFGYHLASHHIGNINRADFQVMIGGHYGPA